MPKLKLEKRNFINNIFLILKGIAMGTANKVPGVSGGVVAFVGGFYEEFIYSLQKINFTAFKLFFDLRWKSFWQYINGNFLGLLILGMLVSYFSVSKILDFFLERYELYVWALFFGMIIGSIIYISKNYEGWSFRNFSLLFLGTVVGLSISLLQPATENDALWFVFVCGIIGVSGMTLPGLSGSFILILLGNYVLLLVDAVNVLYDTFSLTVQNDFSFLKDEKHMRLLTGFIAGSLGVVWPWKEKFFKISETGVAILDPNGKPVLDHYERFIPHFSLQTTVALLWVVIGVATVLYIEWIGNQRKKN